MGHILSAQVGQRIGKEGYLIEKVSKNSVAFQGYKTGQCEQNDLNHNGILKW